MVSRPDRSPRTQPEASNGQNGSESSAKDKARTSDPFYGHKHIAHICARFVTDLFACPDSTDDIPESQRLPNFIAYALHRTKLHKDVIFTALVLLNRLKARFSTARGSSGQRLFLSAYMIASKVVCDDTYSNRSWAIVAQGMYKLREVNQMEREMCTYLDWELNVEPDVRANFEAEVRRKFCDSTCRNPAKEGMMAGARRRIATALQSLGIKSNSDIKDSAMCMEEKAAPADTEEWSCLYSTSRPSNQAEGAETNIYGGEFTSVAGDQTNIYVTVQNNTSSPPAPPPPPRHPPSPAPHSSYCPNPYCPPCPHPFCVPLPPVAFSPAPIPTALYPSPFVSYSPWLVPCIPYTLINGIPTALSFMVACWTWVPTHFPFRWNWH